MGFGGFSWKRALGISAAKARLSRRIGIPLTRSGRQRKLGKLVSGGGCLVALAIVVGAQLILVALLIALWSTSPLTWVRPKPIDGKNLHEIIGRKTPRIGRRSGHGLRLGKMFISQFFADGLRPASIATQCAEMLERTAAGSAS